MGKEFIQKHFMQANSKKIALNHLKRIFFLYLLFLKCLRIYYWITNKINNKIKRWLYTIFIKHFSTKTAEEFCNKLKKKGDAQFNKGQFQYEEIINRKIDIFFSINKITIQKIKILEDCLGHNLIKYRKYYKNNILTLNYTF